MKIKHKFMFALVTTAVLTGCSKDYDFSGRYEATVGDNCEPDKIPSTLLTISPVGSDKSTYTARLASEFASGVFPVTSSAASVSKDGNIVFSFFKQGKASFFSSEPSIDMHMNLIKRDRDHIYISNWQVEMRSEVSSSIGANFDFVKDKELEMMGQRVPNDMSYVAGDKGLCLRRITI
ncbi:hypothetical protein GZ77_05265 [Endozoicomonas montiporae]|uniref:Lipoprotein n=2 Tax=Endozoicomonas montiporae TaxID=1027273 RepID=A0A081NBU3_9GAMM|nr:hypothetical protein [Endozoicomonas montiporae]AMO56223.1 hypothetical protein EZMO1_2104 [Endozoicomonas montiporae CL-33]KEQ15916.1 hypothetical protein GZ77_05265 [Endozoicomonas montiporae]